MADAQNYAQSYVCPLVGKGREAVCRSFLSDDLLLVKRHYNIQMTITFRITTINEIELITISKPLVDSVGSMHID